MSIVVLALLGFAVAGGPSCRVMGAGSPCGLPAGGYPIEDALVIAGALGVSLGVGFSLRTDLPGRRSDGPLRGPAPRSMRSIAARPRVRSVSTGLLAVGVAGVSLVALVLVQVPQPFTMRSAVIGDPHWSCTASGRLEARR